VVVVVVVDAGVVVVEHPVKHSQRQALPTTK